MEKIWKSSTIYRMGFINQKFWSSNFLVCRRLWNLMVYIGVILVINKLLWIHNLLRQTDYTEQLFSWDHCNIAEMSSNYALICTWRETENIYQPRVQWYSGFSINLSMRNLLNGGSVVINFIENSAPQTDSCLLVQFSVYFLFIVDTNFSQLHLNYWVGLRRFE